MPASASLQLWHAHVRTATQAAAPPVEVQGGELRQRCQRRSTTNGRLNLIAINAQLQIPQGWTADAVKEAAQL